jgi:Glycosyltransferase 61
MWTPLPVVDRLRKLARRPARPLAELAVEAWEIAPAHVESSPPALFLPDQWERVAAFSEFSSREGDLRKVRGGVEVQHDATRAFRLRDALLIDGVLYQGPSSLHLHARTRRIPKLRVDGELDRAALYCTFGGNRYFGQWLMDDCATYPLAAAEGRPLTTAQPVNAHTLAYESWLEMQPVRAGAVHLGEVVIFEDIGQNPNKGARFRAMGDKLRAHVRPRPHPGVFIVRGATGTRRVLQNEMEIAERLRDRRGFTIVDPVKADVPAIVQACAGAAMVVGVEGSGLMHGLLMLEAGGGLLVLQPPQRFSAIYKDLTDRDRQQFGFVVGQARGGDFWVDPQEVERTLDLYARRSV